jgi:5-methylcytosine-specific restriction endonuclease McrA
MSQLEKAAYLKKLRHRRATMSPTDKAACLAKERVRDRKRYTDPEKRLSRASTKRRVALRKIRDGICLACTDLATCGQYCFDHWIGSVGRKYELTVRNRGVETLKALWNEQGGACALTGEPLIPGQNASLDHIIPRCRGGTSDRNNLQWTTKEINFFKRTRTDDELIRLSFKVARHAGVKHSASNVLPFKRTSAATEV